MAPDKSPRLEGMTPSLYQNFWTIFEPNVMNFVVDCLNNNFPDSLNDAIIVLIPEKTAPEKVVDLRPIALCNVALEDHRESPCQ